MTLMCCNQKQIQCSLCTSVFFACKAMLLLEVLIKVGEKYLICQYAFIDAIKRSQSALQTLVVYFLYNIKNVPAFLEMA